MSETKRTCPFGTVGDQNQKAILYQILQNGFRDENPRPHYEDMYHNAHLSDDCKYVITEDGNKIEIEEGTAFTNGSDEPFMSRLIRYPLTMLLPDTT